MSRSPSLLGWLGRPRPGHGIHFAGRRDSWTWRSYEELADLALRAATVLQDRVGPGGTVGLALPAGPAFVAGFFGSLLAGAVPCPLATPQGFGDVVRWRDHLTLSAVATGLQLLVTTPEIAGTLGPPPAPVLLAPDLAAGRTAPLRPAPASADGLALLQLSSGSTGPAKAVQLTRGALEANLDAIAAWLRWGPEDAVATWLPVAHDMGLIGCLLTPVVQQTDVWLLQPGDFLRRPARYLDCLGRRGARLTALPDFGLRYLAERVRPRDLDGCDFAEVRSAIVGAEVLSPGSLAAADRLLAPFGWRPSVLTPAYGLAEATLAVTGSAVDAPWTAIGIDAGRARFERPVTLDGTAEARTVVSCGRPLDQVSVSIVDDSGCQLPDGCLGEVAVRGASVSGGYRGPPAGTDTELCGDRLLTGDAGFLLDGELYVLGRIGDGTKIRGRPVFAEELEALLPAGLGRDAAVVVGHAGPACEVVVVVQRPVSSGLRASIAEALRQPTEGGLLTVVEVAKGTITRTSSGKTKRRLLWRRHLDGTLTT